MDHLRPPNVQDPLLAEKYVTFLNKVYSKLCMQLPLYIQELLDTFKFDMTEEEYKCFQTLDPSPNTVSLILNWVYKDKDRFVPLIRFIMYKLPHIYINMPSMPIFSDPILPVNVDFENELFDEEYTSDIDIPPVAYKLSDNTKYLNFASETYTKVRAKLLPRKARLVFLLQRLYTDLGEAFLLMCESHDLYKPRYPVHNEQTIEELLHDDCSDVIKAKGLYYVMLEHSSMHDLYILCYVILPYFKNPNIALFVKTIQGACKECKVDLQSYRAKVLRLNSV